MQRWTRYSAALALYLLAAWSAAGMAPVAADLPPGVASAARGDSAAKWAEVDFARKPAAVEVAAESTPAAPSTAPTPSTRPTPSTAPMASASAVLLDFASEEGLARLARTPAKPDFAPLANQFEAQSNGAFCGPASAAIVLNALYSGRRPLPRDRSRLREADVRYLPAGADLSLPRFTQDNVIERGAKTRAQVFGEPMASRGGSASEASDFGFQLAQLDELLRANGARTRKVVVDDALPDAAIRADLVGNLERGGDYVIVNYLRKAAGQAGGGHISPLAAYDAASDSFLVLDVNPSAAPWVWMPTASLIRGMRTIDQVENRGYLLVAPE